jgi:hypothetical protein
MIEKVHACLCVCVCVCELFAFHLCTWLWGVRGIKASIFRFQGLPDISGRPSALAPECASPPPTLSPGPAQRAAGDGRSIPLRRPHFRARSSPPAAPCAPARGPRRTAVGTAPHPAPPCAAFIDNKGRYTLRFEYIFLPHTHTHTHASKHPIARTHTHTHTHIHTHAHTPNLTHTSPHTLSLSHTHTPNRSHTLTNIRTVTHIHTHIHSPTHNHIQAHTQTHSFTNSY